MDLKSDMKRGTKDVFEKKFLIGFLIICFGLMVILVSVERVRAAGATPVTLGETDVPKDPTKPPTQMEDYSQVSSKTFETQTGIKTDNTMNGAKYDPAKKTLEKSGKSADLSNAPKGTEVKMSGNNGQMDIKSSQGTYEAKANGNYKVNSDGSVQNLGASSTTAVEPKGPGGPSAQLKGPGTCSADPSAAGGGGGSEGGAAGASGSKTPGADAALQGAMSALGYIGQLGIKADTFKKQPNAPELKLPESSVAEASVSNGGIATVTDGTKTTTLAQNDQSKTGWIKGSSLKDFDTGNSVIVVYGSVDAIFDTPDTITHIKNDLSKDSPAFDSGEKSNSGVLAGILPLVSAETLTGEVTLGGNSAQHLDLIGYNIGMGGEKIGILVLKPFDNVNAKGSYLNVIDGDAYIEFKGPKTYYPREIEGTNFFINRLQNDYDLKNFFKLAPGGAKGNYLVDGNKILTVGDAVVKNPLEGYENITIPKTREAMWKKAAEIM